MSWKDEIDRKLSIVKKMNKERRELLKSLEQRLILKQQGKLSVDQGIALGYDLARLDLKEQIADDFTDSAQRILDKQKGRKVILKTRKPQ